MIMRVYSLFTDRAVDRLLDEVTTHVDAPTIQAIAVALRTFTGGIILVTHDR